MNWSNISKIALYFLIASKCLQTSANISSTVPSAWIFKLLVLLTLISMQKPWRVFPAQRSMPPLALWPHEMSEDGPLWSLHCRRLGRWFRLVLLAASRVFARWHQRKSLAGWAESVTGNLESFKCRKPLAQISVLGLCRGDSHQ